MSDETSTALLRSVLDEVCGGVAQSETGARAHIAARLLEAAAKGEKSREGLTAVGRAALEEAPTMWR